MVPYCPTNRLTAAHIVCKMRIIHLHKKRHTYTVCKCGVIIPQTDIQTHTETEVILVNKAERVAVVGYTAGACKGNNGD